MPYDADVDIWMDGDYWDTKEFNELRRNWTRQHNFQTQYKDIKGKLWVLYSKNNSNGLDLYPWYNTPDGYLRFLHFLSINL